MILSHAITHTADTIRHQFGEDEATLIARYYFEDTLGHTLPDYLMSKSEISIWQEDLEDLVAGCPLQYVTGVAHFYGRAFLVSDAVLIPRAETEELVREVVNHCKSAGQPMRVLDVGTGSGCIAIAIKKALKSQAMVTAIDDSEEALAVAIDNTQLLDAHVMMRRCDALDHMELADLGSYDVVVSNPPYIPPSEASLMPDHVRDREPHMALFVPEEDPLLFYRSILSAEGLVKPGGHYFFEINEHLGPAMLVLADSLVPDASTEIIQDLQGKDRIVHIATQGTE